MIPLVHAAATLFLTGLIWFVQVVHYPLMSRAGGEEFRRYEQEHRRLTGFVVAPPMLVELGAAGWLAIRPPFPGSEAAVWTGLTLVVLIWTSTALLQVPAHNALSRGFDAAAHRRLVASNWVRTVAWTARSALALWLLASGKVDP